MSTLPDADAVADEITKVLDAIDTRQKKDPFPDTGAWFQAISGDLAVKLQPFGSRCYARNQPLPCVGGEWLFDFCALLYDEELPPQERFLTQAIAIGEVEWGTRSSQIDDDFEKLLVADALVLFMIFEQWSRADAEVELDRLEKVAMRRQEFVRLRGINQPPIFLLSCWIIPKGPFIHRKLN